MISDLIKIDFILGFLLLLPGYSFLIALMKNKNPLGFLGTFSVSVVLSLGIVNFSLILIDKLGLSLTNLSISATISLISLAGFAFFLKSKKITLKKEKEPKNEKIWLLFFIIIAFSVFIRLIFLVPKAIPHTTDLGHHMYWVNYIIQFQEIPTYDIPDVIIGEHLIFAATSILTNIGIISSLHLTMLFLINIFSLLAVFLLTKELANTFLEKKSANYIAILSLISIGIFYSIASPQANYINGGVIGNILGNFMIPMTFYLLIKALKDKNSTIAALAFFSMGNLAYTHHLSAFILIYVLIGFFLLFLSVFGLKKLLLKKEPSSLKQFLSIFINIKTISVVIFFVLFALFIRIPSYLNLSAIDTAVGSPSKETRVGLTLNNLIHSTGPWRIFYSGVGILFLLWILLLILKPKIKDAEYKITNKDFLSSIASISLSLTWFGIIFVMSHWPAVLKIDIISGRIANYLTYPSAILAAFGIFAILKPIFSKSLPTTKLMIFSIIFIPGIISGLFDVSESYPEKSDEDYKTTEIFRGSEYLTQKTSPEQKILKDHIYLVGDTWVKNFLMRGYEEPISRTFLRKYADKTKDRETCTRDMIAIPETEVGKNCFKENGIEFIILQDGYDTTQFEKSNNFSKIFSTKNVVIFQRTKLDL